MRRTRQLGAVLSSINCSTAGFWTLLSLSKPSLQLLLSSHKRSQATAVCVQWLQVGGERCWQVRFHFDVLIYFLIFFEKKVRNIDHNKLFIPIEGNQVWN